MLHIEGENVLRMQSTLVSRFCLETGGAMVQMFTYISHADKIKTEMLHPRDTGIIQDALRDFIRYEKEVEAHLDRAGFASQRQIRVKGGADNVSVALIGFVYHGLEIPLVVRDESGQHI